MGNTYGLLQACEWYYFFFFLPNYPLSRLSVKILRKYFLFLYIIKIHYIYSSDYSHNNSIHIIFTQKQKQKSQSKNTIIFFIPLEFISLSIYSSIYFQKQFQTTMYKIISISQIISIQIFIFLKMMTIIKPNGRLCI